jgi:hypothetical protein
MIKITKLPETPLALQEVQNQIAEQLIEKLTANKKFKWETVHYSDPIKEDLKELYKEKCAFCEQKLKNTDTDNKFTVEHYRPKNGGYTWLGAEWTNLFPTCNGCNVAKADLFPLLRGGIKVTNPPLDSAKNLIAARCKADCDELLAEKPKYLHPEIDDVEKFFVFLPSGKADIAPDLTSEEKQRADEMTRTFLNRPRIEEKRKAKINEMRESFRMVIIVTLKLISKLDSGIFDEYCKEAFSVFFDKLNDAQKDEEEFAGLARSMQKNFDSFFIGYLQSLEQCEDAIKLAKYAYELSRK